MTTHETSTNYPTDAWQRLFFAEPDTHVELRILNKERGIAKALYFDNPHDLAQAAKPYDGEANLHVTLNPVKRGERAGPATSTNDVARRRLILLDFDPDHPKDTNTTDEEHEAALALAREGIVWLREQGCTSLVLADSGNGAHILLPVDLLNDDDSTRLVKRILEAVALKFDTVQVHVDTCVHDASRLTRLYGATNCKGPHTAERPRRRPQILSSMPNSLEPVSREVLEQLAAQTPPTQAKRVDGTKCSLT